MAAPSDSSSLGPAVFVGLCLYMLVTGSPVEHELLNPSDTMDMQDVALAPKRKNAVAPFPSHDPAEQPPKAPVLNAYVTLSEGGGDALLGNRGSDIERVVYTELTVELSARPKPVPLRFDPAPINRVPRSSRAQSIVRSAAEANYPAPRHDWVELTGNFINVRQGPGTQFESLIQLNEGTRGLVVERKAGWALVQFFNTEPPKAGWIVESLLERVTP